MPKGILYVSIFVACGLLAEAGQDVLSRLGEPQDFISKRVSSFDRTGGNRDSLAIDPGKTAVLADIPGPAAIHHIWVTISAESFYGRKIILRIYWDGEDVPSIEAPIGDFFGVGHGLNRNFTSLPINCSSAGRARNCFWYMPFRRSCRITATNEGRRPVAAFYYYVDYRELGRLPPDTPYFHAQYRQEFPCAEGKNYLILDAKGEGHYVGCNLSILQRAMGWWGEGDDMIFVDGEPAPSLHGTGSEDYFSDAWGMREDESPFYGCPLQEEDFQAGSKATVYRFHIPDPIPFKKSLRMAIEHGHANDRSDFYSSVAYWYQTEPHRPFPPLPAVSDRLPFALESSSGFLFPRWEDDETSERSVFADAALGLRFSAPRLVPTLSSYYNPAGERYPVLMTDGATAGTQAALRFPVAVSDIYTIELTFLQGPNSGDFDILRTGGEAGGTARETHPLATFHGYSEAPRLASVEIEDVHLEAGHAELVFRTRGRHESARGMETPFVGLRLVPSARRFIKEWNLIGPFPAADMDDIQTPFPPEGEIDMGGMYKGKDNTDVGWRIVRAAESGYIRLEDIIRPNEQALVYGLVYVFSPDDRKIPLLVGSDDGVKIWINDAIVHVNPAYRAAAPDQDTVMVRLHRGWNKVLVKVLQGAGGWGFFMRFADPKGELRWNLSPENR